MKVYRAEFTTQERNLIAPRDGQIGRCWKASGHNDPDSIEYDAWLFQPDHNPNGYYCDFSNLIILGEVNIAGQHLVPRKQPVHK